MKSLKYLTIFNLLFCATVAAEDKISFNEKIRPILNRSCTGCHGGVKKAGEVSFIYREEALGKGKSGKQVIVPGHPEQSEMFKRITTTNPKNVMPPVKGGHGKPLNKKEVSLIEEWIKQGADYEQHWAYIKPKLSTVEVNNKTWAKQGMDAFVLARMEKNHFKPTKEASKAQWLRRASLDLIGLPPTLNELETFEKNTAENAYEVEVDRLLKSKHYGERWASIWLDIARYADTVGYEKDPHRDIWPYRDWIVNAFNKDLPYDTFLRDQLAGDLLPNPTWEQLLATAFHRNTQTNTEGGTDDEEFRVQATIDRVNTTWTATQGITFGCTQCHSHPYEPIPHGDYYSFMDFFNSTEDADLDSDYPKILIANDPKQRQKAVSLQQSIKQLEQQKNKPGQSLIDSARWVKLSYSQLKASAGKLTEKNDILVSTGTHPVRTSFDLIATSDTFSALKVSIIPDASDPKDLPERGSVLSHLEVFHVKKDGSRQKINFSATYADAITGSYKAEQSLQPSISGFGGYPKLFRQREVVFVTPTPVVMAEGDSLNLLVRCKASTTGGQATTLRNFKFETSQTPQWHAIANSPERHALQQKINQQRQELGKIKGTQVPIFQQRPVEAERETRLFVGGLWLNKGERFTGKVPEILNNYKSKATNRLEMAQWLVHKDNPQTSRVMVNRLFAHLFGRGIVGTLGDFGSTGLHPSNPELLDYLAIKYQDDYKYSTKKILKEMVLSATYRQDNRTSLKAAQKDPHNEMLARGPRTRLSAEMIRDNALSVAGVISYKTGGPSVMPPQPDGIWQSVYSGAKWVNAKGENRYRRAIYTYWKRTSPYPSLLTFDAPTRDICSAQRIPTNTPLHALVTMNDPVFLECSQILAKRLVKEAGPKVSDQITHGYKLATQANITPTILNTLLTLHQSLVKQYTADKNFAPIAKTPEAAASVIIANALLNLDAAITK